MCVCLLTGTQKEEVVKKSGSCCHMPEGGLEAELSLISPLENVPYAKQGEREDQQGLSKSSDQSFMSILQTLHEFLSLVDSHPDHCRERDPRKQP